VRWGWSFPRNKRGGGAKLSLVSDPEVWETLRDPALWLLFAALMAAGAVSVLWHELGHLAASMLFGVPARELSLSRGRPFVDFDIGTLRVTLRWPLRFAGRVTSYSLALNRPRDLLAATLGGPLANLLAAAALEPLSYAAPGELLPIVLHVTALLNFAWFVLNLVPYQRVLKSGEVSMTDGLRLIQRWKAGRKDIDAARAMIETALRGHAPKDAPAPVLTQATMRAVTVASERRELDEKLAARQMQLWRREYARDHTQAERRFMKYVFLVRMIYRDAPFDRADIEAFANDLIEDDPERGIYQLVRAAAQVSLGEGEAAHEALAHFAALPKLAPEFTILVFWRLARIANERGDLEGARAAIRRAADAAATIENYEQSDFGEAVATLRDALGVEPFRSPWARGAA